MKQLRVRKKGGEGIRGGGGSGARISQGENVLPWLFLECFRVQFREEKDIPKVVTLNYVR